MINSGEIAQVVDSDVSPAHHMHGSKPMRAEDTSFRSAKTTQRFVRRLQRELQTIAAMIGIYCRGHHRSAHATCTDCEDLLAYARARLDHCPYGPDKPTCVNCPIHCYRPAQREQVKRIMRYAGPRMLLRHPILALLHKLDGVRAAPPIFKRGIAKGSPEVGNRVHRPETP